MLLAACVARCAPNNSMLAVREAYETWVTLTVPESDVNMGAGTAAARLCARFTLPLHVPLLPGAFMVHMDFLTPTGALLATCSRPVVMRWASLWVRITRIAAFALPYALGLMEETQTHSVMCFDNFRESRENPLGRECHCPALHRRRYKLTARCVPRHSHTSAAVSPQGAGV